MRGSHSQPGFHQHPPLEVKESKSGIEPLYAGLQSAASPLGHSDLINLVANRVTEGRCIVYQILKR